MLRPNLVFAPFPDPRYYCSVLGTVLTCFVAVVVNHASLTSMIIRCALSRQAKSINLVKITDPEIGQRVLITVLVLHLQKYFTPVLMFFTCDKPMLRYNILYIYISRALNQGLVVAIEPIVTQM